MNIGENALEGIATPCLRSLPGAKRFLLARFTQRGCRRKKNL